MHKFLLITALILLIPAAEVFADGEWDDQVPVRQPTQEERNSVNAASDASFDKRLPPVLPGERMNDSGKTIRVWSTAGPVPVGKSPEPWNKEGGVSAQHQAGSVGVIVDRRHDHEVKDQAPGNPDTGSESDGVRR